MFIILLVVTAVTFLLYKWMQKPNNFPPGPRGLPLVGNLLSLYSDRPIQENLMQMSKQYGPLTGLFIGKAPCVAVCGYKAVKEVSMREDCTGRPDGILLRARAFNKRLGVLFSDGPLWKEQRRFTLRHLRDFGFGKRSMEGLIHEEVATVLSNLEKRAVDTKDMMTDGVIIQDLFPVSVINILWSIMSGVRYAHDNKQFRTLMTAVDDFFRNGSPTGGLMAMPWLRFVPIVNRPYYKQIDSVTVLQNFVQKTIDEHKESFQEDSMRDFIDVFIHEMRAQKDKEESTFTEQQLIVLCMDLFLAGTETTSSSLAYLLLYMILYPEVQTKVREEIHRVVGRDRLPGIEDAAKLDYIQAVIHEVLRHSALVPITPPHITMSKVKLMGYDLPKRTVMLVNLYSVFMDKDHWGDPENFRPERHLNSEGRFVKDEHLVFFGLGPRFCLGEPLARNSTFLFATSILQSFCLSQPTERPSPNMNHLQGFTTSPRPYYVTVKKM